MHTFDVEHGAGDGVQSLIRNFTSLIQLDVFQREETFPAFRLNVTRLKNGEHTELSSIN